MIGIDLEYDVWIDTQVELLKAGKLRDLDVTGLIEELEDLGRREKAACRSCVYQIILHKLLCDYWEAQKARNLGHWQAEINSFQFQLCDRITTNIKQDLEKDLEKIYQKVLKAVIAKTSQGQSGVDYQSGERRKSYRVIPAHSPVFPKSCPYAIEEIIGN